MSERTINELQQLQALPLSAKIKRTKRKIREWVNEFGVEGVYVSFSGGKDSTVLLDIARQMYPDIPAVFADTGLEYPEIREFVKTFDNVEWLKPKMTFRQVIEKYGYPFISKEVSERIYYAQKYLTWYMEQNRLDRPTPYGMCEVLGIPRKSELRQQIYKTRTIPSALMEYAKSGKKGSYKARELCGLVEGKDGKTSMFDYSKWLWLASCPYLIGNHCCYVMKKSPLDTYAKRTGRVPITGQMAAESKLRLQRWMESGCNAFDAKKQVSNPMAFWTDQDVLLYIYQNKTPICSVYGEVVKDNGIDGQMDLEDLGLFELERPLLKTTGCNRTGCMFCGFGAHLEKGEGRFEMMEHTHPKQYEYIMKPWDDGGLGYKEVIDWINKHGNLNIRY